MDGAGRQHFLEALVHQLDARATATQQNQRGCSVYSTNGSWAATG
jgi:hypothetical protein